MKKIMLFLIVAVVSGLSGFAQKSSVETVSLSLRTYADKDERLDVRKHALEEAKKHADLSFANPTTSNDPKMWLMRARTYVAISLDNLGEGGKPLIEDKDAIETAVKAIINMHKSDEDERFTKTTEGVMVLVNAAIQANIIADIAYRDKDYERSIKYYDLATQLFPYDTEKQLKRNNLSIEKLQFFIAISEKLAGHFEDAKKHFQELININYNDPWIYLELYAIYLEQDHDTAMAIQTIDAARKKFEDNMSIKNQQIAIYVKTGKADDLIRVLNENIEMDEYNASNYYLRGVLYNMQSKSDLAETDFKKALEYDDELLEAHADLGDLYVNKGADIAIEAGKLNFNEEAKFNKLMAETKEYYMKAIVHYEKIKDFAKDDKTRNTYTQRLLGMYLKTEQQDKYNALKAEIGK